MKEQFELNQYFRVLETAGEDETEAKLFYCDATEGKVDRGKNLLMGKI